MANAKYKIIGDTIKVGIDFDCNNRIVFTCQRSINQSSDDMINVAYTKATKEMSKYGHLIDKWDLDD